MLIFARETKENEWGGTQSYTCLGPATYRSHEGSRPIAITYDLRHPMPIEVFQQASVTA